MSDANWMLEGYCCAGGAAMGYSRAGWEVAGVDIDPQPNYPFWFHQGDVLDVLARLIRGEAIRFIRMTAGRLEEQDLRLSDFAAAHGSPPCQLYTPLNAYNHKVYPDLIEPTRDLFRAAGLPYIIENVEAARPKLINPTLLCGPTFGLKMYRHRLFETSFHVEEPLHWGHKELCTRNGYLPTLERPFMTITGGKHSKAWQEAAAGAMGTPWMRTVREVCESIPPLYTEFLGAQLLARLASREAA